MRLTLSWLREFLPEIPSVEILSERLTSLGIEVESIETVEAPFKGVVIGEVREVAPHPQAEKLVIAQVWDGQTLTPVVCGASNCRAGLRTAWARPGAELPSKDGKIKISTATLRGVESFGMLCSIEELGLGSGNEGIWEIGADTEPGANLEALWGDVIFHLGLTPNLGHVMSVLGIAREISASFEIPLIDPAIALNSLSDLPKGREVKILFQHGCSQYHLLEAQGTWPKASPWLWQKRLLLSGIRPIHPVVDVTNLVLLERGQPMHSFDCARLVGPLEVRLGHQGEQCSLLDGTTHDISNLLAIADAHQSVAVAGVMGGAASSVQANTHRVLLECAVFNSNLIRQASKKLAIRSESSVRFERGIDAGGCMHALKRAAQLLEQVGGSIQSLTSYGKAPLSRSISVTTPWIVQRLGLHLSQNEIEGMLLRLRCTVTSRDDLLTVEPPSDRNDLQEPIDLVEEVARLYGYDHLLRQEPAVRLGSLPPDPVYTGLERAREALVAQGLQEFLTCALISPPEAALISHPQEISVTNPASLDHSVLRPSLLPGLLQTLQTNQARREGSVAGFEIGRVHLKDLNGTGYDEPWTVGIVLCGDQEPASWSQKTQEWDFFSAKGLLQSWSAGLGLKEHWDWKRGSHPLLHPHRQAVIYWNGHEIGRLGELHPRAVKDLGLRGRPIVAECALAVFLEALKTPPQKMTAPSEYPSTERDLTLPLPKHLAVGHVEDAITKARSSLLESWQLTSVFPDPVKIDTHHVTWRFQYRDPHRTLTGAEVDAAQAGLVEKLVSALASVEE